MNPTSQLADLEELVGKCHDGRTKALIKEALECYFAGAFRSCIVSTWIAVAFDYLYKLEEISNDEPKALTEKNQFYTLCQNRDISQLLTFERDFLDRARDTYLFISIRDHDELKRIFDDRNYCAHPSIDTTHEPYAPSAELARTHLRNAVELFCQHAPTQGAAAKTQIWESMRHTGFPRDTDMVRVFLDRGPLRKLRPSARREFIGELISKSLSSGTPTSELARVLAVLKAMHIDYTQELEDWLRNKLPAKVQRLEDKDRFYLVRLLHEVPVTRLHVQATDYELITPFVAEIPSNDPAMLAAVSAIPGLRAAFNERIKGVTPEQLLKVIYKQEPGEFNLAIECLSRADQFAEGTEVLKDLIDPLVAFFELDIAKNFVITCAENYEVHGAHNTFPGLLNRMFQRLNDRHGDGLKEEWLQLYRKLNRLRTVMHLTMYTGVCTLLETTFGFDPKEGLPEVESAEAQKRVAES